MNTKSLGAACTAVVTCFGSMAPPASALELDASLRARLSFETNSPRDLGLAGGSDSNIAYLDLSPRLAIVFDPKLTGFVRGQFFAPTENLAAFDDGAAAEPQVAGTFGRIYEAWLQFNGLTSYPGETLRVGRQLILEDGADWMGQTIDAVRWTIDTTLFRASAAVLYPLSAYRTDDIPVPPVQRDRLYGYLNVAADWSPEQRLGLRVLHGSDQKNLPDIGRAVDAGAKLQDDSLTWIGVYADNGYYLRRSRQRLHYSADVSYVTGTSNTATVAGGVVTGSARTRVGAFAGTGALRWKPIATQPVSLGFAYTWSQGGGENQYRQNGLHSNISYFAGTQTLINRYSNTVRAELGNLKVVTAMATYNLGDWDAALIYENLHKDVASAPVQTNNISAPTLNGSKDVGNGLDLVLTRFFDSPDLLGAAATIANANGDPQQSSLRLRASVFDPGAAYGPGVNKFHYRIILEGTLWLF